jgi:hypothetical protein
MNRTFGKYLVGFMLVTLMAASALPTMAGRLKSYDGSTGILLLEMEDKSVRKFILNDKTKVEWMGRNTAPGALRAGSKISIQVLGSLGASPLKAGKIVDWGNSEKIVATGAVSVPYHTAVSEYASTAGGGGVPDGAPKMNDGAHQTMATIAHGGSQNQPTGPNGYSADTGIQAQGQAQPYPGPSSGGTQQYTNQGASMTAPLEMMNIDPYSSSSSQMGMNVDPYNPSQMGMNDGTSLMGGDETGSDPGTMQAAPGMETAYGGNNQTITGQVLESAIEQGYVVVQSFEHPNLLRVLLQQSNAPMQLLTPGQMIQVTGQQTPQGFRAVEIKAAGGY